MIWGPSYATGAAVSGRLGQFDYAAEIKNASLSSRPESWDATEIGFDHPTFSGRAGFHPNAMWNLGVSASGGAYFRPETTPTLPAGAGLGDYREFVLGQDISFACGSRGSVLDCASPLALSVRLASIAKAPEDWRSPKPGGPPTVPGKPHDFCAVHWDHEPIWGVPLVWSPAFRRHG